jgi:SAM-dependent methyltransferase
MATESRDAAPSLPSRPTAGRCPSCGTPQLVHLLDLRDLPIHTSMLLSSRREAVATPRANLSLDVCKACGLISNSAFDAPGHDYSASYEEVQSFSPRFRAYAAQLADELVERHALAGRDVFEIGSGRGDFLTELVSRTSGRGVAVDPSYRDGDLASEFAGRISIDKAFFAAEQVPPNAGAIVCRHTLEHVHDVATFLRELRAGLDRTSGAVALFEVPDTRRVLEDGAFWDLYYEHCSYFTPGSLARAFRTAGLAPSRLERTFEDQYLFITATIGHREPSEPLPEEETAAEVVALAERFSAAFNEARRRWQDRLHVARARAARTVIWGAGSKGVGFLSMLGVADEVDYAVDVNPDKHGMFMPGTGHEIVSPDRLADRPPDLVVVMNPVYVDEIARDLAQRGIETELVTVAGDSTGVAGGS